MGLTRLAIARPVTMLMMIAALVLAGLVSFARLPVQEMPNVNFPFVIVSASYPGANPEDVLQTITQPIENAVSGVAGIQQMNGISADGASLVAVEFTGGTDVNTAANDVAQAVNRVQGQLPAGLQPPAIIKADPNAMPIMNIVLSGSLLPGQLYNLADNVLQPALQQVAGVANVEIQGGLVPQVNVTVDPGRLQAYGISLQQLASVIAAQNVSLPGGDVTFSGQTASARTNAYYQSAGQLTDLVVATRPGSTITLGQLGTVEQGYAAVTQEATFNGANAVGLSVTAQSGANVVAVDAAVKAELASLQSQMPSSVVTHVVNDQTVYTDQAMRAVEEDLALAVLLPALVLLFFLHRPRNMFIVVLSIPTSLIATFAAMFFLGFSLDLISLLALSLITGILVDDSIVVLENINRHLAMGKEPRAAALEGRSEIGLAAIAITLTDVVVYAPIAFTSGIVGEVFREFGLTIVAATLFSLFISFTLTPMLASRWLHAGEGSIETLAVGTGAWARLSEAWERRYARLRDGYGRLITAALRRRPLVLLVGVAALVVSVAFLPLGWVGTEFAPQEDNSQFTVSVQLPVGTPLSVTAQTMRRLDAQIRAMPGVADTYMIAGSSGGFFATTSTYSGEVAADLLPVGRRPAIGTYLARVRALSVQYPGATMVPQVQTSFAGGSTQALSVVLMGPNIDTLDGLAGQVATALQGLPGLADVRNQAAQQAPEMAVQVNRQLAGYFGLTAQSVGSAVQTAIAGTTVSYLRPTGSANQTPIVLGVQGGDALAPEQIEGLPLSVPTATAAPPSAVATQAAPAAGPTPGATVLLGQIAHVVAAQGPVQLNDQDRQLQVTVSAAANGIPLGTAVKEVRAAMAAVPLPSGYSWTLGGAAQQQQMVFGPLVAALAMSIALVYMVTAALYESLLQPLAVMFSLPLASVGALGALAVSGNTLNLFSFMGLIMLMGLVAKNAILLIDFTNTLRARGMTREAALVEAGRARLRPILMTTATMVFAMLPLALKFGAGSEDRSPMATVLVGGLITSTLLTLVFVPVMYTYLDEMAVRLGHRGREVRSASPPG